MVVSNLHRAVLEITRSQLIDCSIVCVISCLTSIRKLFHETEAEHPVSLRLQLSIERVTLQLRKWLKPIDRSIRALTDLTKEALPWSFLIEVFYVFCLVLRDFPLGLSPWTSSFSCSGTNVTTTRSNNFSDSFVFCSRMFCFILQTSECFRWVSLAYNQSVVATVCWNAVTSVKNISSCGPQKSTVIVSFFWSTDRCLLRTDLNKKWSLP